MFARIITYAVALVALVAPVNTAQAQPYGGCDEAWQAPQSRGADACRAAGWIVKPRLVINPHGVVESSSLPLCRSGSASERACAWNVNVGRFTVRGFYLRGHRQAHYAWATTPVGHGWKWVEAGMADALAEGEYRRATTRNWERCAHTKGRLLCPDGTVVRW